MTAARTSSDTDHVGPFEPGLTGRKTPIRVSQATVLPEPPGSNDPEAVFDGYWRDSVERRVDPIGAALHRAGITANVLTTTGVALSVATAIAIGNGRLGLGFILLILAAVPDLLDGAVAKAAGPTSKRGAFFDSTADRVTDTVVLIGITWHLIETDEGLQILVAVGVMAGIMERAERIILIAIALAIPDLLIPVLWILLFFTLVTATQRFIKVWRQATEQLHQSDQSSSE